MRCFVSLLMLAITSTATARAQTASAGVRAEDAPSNPLGHESRSSAALTSPVSDASERYDASHVHVDLIAGTAAPLMLGAAAQVELPYRLQLRIDLGWMPAAYVALINEFLIGIGAYDRTTATLVAASIENSFIFRASVGWRPFESEGFEVLAGYTLATAGGGLTGAEVIEAATMHMIDRRSGREIPLAATLHAVHAWLAWSLEPVRYWVLRFAVGWVHTLASSAQVGSSSTSFRWQQAAADYLARTLNAWGFAPEIHVTSGVRL